MECFSTPQALTDFRKQIFREALDRTRSAWGREDELQKKGDLATDRQRSLLSFSEERQLFTWYLGKIRDYCKFFKFDKHVEAASLILFQRFYLYCSLLEYDAKQVLMCCIFLATKIEHKIIPLTEFLGKIPKSPSPVEIVDLELTVSAVLKFDFMIKNPYWPLHGLFLDLQVFIQDQESLSASEKQTILQNLLVSYNAAFQLVAQALQTDLIFLYPPSQIALSCLWACQTPDIQLKDYIVSRLAVPAEVGLEESVERPSSKLVQLATMLAHEIRSHSIVEKDLAKSLAMKAEAAFSPEFDSKSLLFQELQKTRKDLEEGGDVDDVTNPF